MPSDRVAVAGFSQGGAIALMALRSDKKLAGVVGLSTVRALAAVALDLAAAAGVEPP